MDLSDLDKMRLGVKYRFPVKLRGYEFLCRPLTVIECTEVAIETANDLNNKPHLRHVPLGENVLFAIKTLSRASTSAPDARDMQLHEAVLQQLTPDELMFIFSEYKAIVDRVAPLLQEVSEERITELLDLAKKNHTALIDFSFAEAIGCCRALLRAQPTDK